MVQLKNIQSFFSGLNTLFIVDDVISDEAVDKRRSALLKMATSGRHDKHSLWILTQVYNGVPKTIRRQAKMLFTFYPKDRSDLKIIDEESNIIDDWKDVKEALKNGKHTALYLRLEHPRSYQII